MFDSRIFEKNVWFLLGGTRGGAMRARIMHELMVRPQNANQLAEKIGVDYKTVRHHLDVLLKNNWITPSQNKYGEQFFVAFTPEQQTVFERIWSQIGKKL